MKVPWTYVERMQKKDPTDPLLLECLPLGQPTIAGFSKDPLQESSYHPIPGVLHKYTSRILVTVTGACPIHCRYCFRQHFPYNEQTKGILPKVITYLSQQPEVSEVILSGGDPLMLADTKLAQWYHALEAIPHIHTIRLHTRMPVLIPQRITQSFLDLCRHSRLQTVLVSHVNHPQALNDHTQQAFHRCKKAGMHLLNQSVLLKGINDSSATLVSLSQRLFKQHVLPYYLHQLDSVSGAESFFCTQETMRDLYQDIQKRLPGYLVPQWVKEEPGKPHKTRLQ